MDIECFFCICWNDHVVFDLLLWCVMLICVCWTILVNLGWIPLGRVTYASMILTCNFLFWWFLPLVLVLEWWWLYRMSLRLFSLLQSFIFFFERICLWCPLVLGFLYWKFSFVYPFKEPALDFVDFFFPINLYFISPPPPSLFPYFFWL